MQIFFNSKYDSTTQSLVGWFHGYGAEIMNKPHIGGSLYTEVQLQIILRFFFFFFFEVKKRVEFNLYLQDTAKYEIPHRNKKAIERRSFIQYVQFGTVQV